MAIEEEPSPRGSIDSPTSHGDYEEENSALLKARKIAMTNGPATQVR